MVRKILFSLLAVAALIVTPVITVSADAVKEAAKPAAAMVKGNHQFANELAVCGCGKVFVPNAGTKTFTYENKEYACCSEECHKKLASMSPADAARACEDQLKKLTMPAQAAAPKK